MKNLVKQIAYLERVDRLIRLKATGSPKQLAKRLDVSEATVFRLIDTMKILNAPISYDFTIQSYTYSELVAFKCGFYITPLEESIGRNLTGGCSYNNLKLVLKL